MRSTPTLLVLLLSLAWRPVAAQPADPAPTVEPEAPSATPAETPPAAAEPTPEAPADVEAEEPPLPVLEVAPMPGPNEDFTIDKDLFREVETDPESELIREASSADRLAASERPLYQRMPGLAIFTEAVAGLFGAGAFGLLGGSIGEAIDPGDDGLAFGGVHGALIGGLVGSFFGAAGGVWGAAQLFEKDLGVGWALLGSALGTAVGGSIAFGLVEGIEGAGDGAEIAGVALLFMLQVGGTIGLTEAFLEPPEPGPARIDTPLPGEVGQSPRYFILPFVRGEF